MIQRLRRRFRSPLPPQSQGKQIYVADSDAMRAARESFTTPPFSHKLPSTALQEAKLNAETGYSEIVQAFLRTLGRIPYRTDTTAVRLAVWDCGDYIQEYVAIPSSERQMVSSYVLIPKTTSIPKPALLAIHGHGGNFLWGKSKVTALRPGTETYGYGQSLVRQGYIVVAPDLACFEDRNIGIAMMPGPWPQDGERLVFGNLLLKGATLLGWNLFELSCIIDYMVSRNDVDSDRIGVVGHSMGGTLAPLLMLFDSRIQTGVASCGLGTWRTIMAQHVIHNFSCYAPGLLEAGDMDMLLPNLAPRPFMVIAGEQDPNFPIEGVLTLEAALAANYTTHKASAAFQMRIDNGGHHFDLIRQKKALDFLTQWMPKDSPREAV